MRPTDTTTAALISIITDSGTLIRTYDDGQGPLWVYRESTGIFGVIRAQTREDAFEIVEDEFMSEATETWEDIAKDCGCANPDALMDNAIFQEAYGFRPNGANERDSTCHGIYQRDLNGESLDKLTPKLMAELRLAIVLAEG